MVFQSWSLWTARKREKNEAERRRRSNASTGRCRPRLERLEDRTLLDSTLQVITVASTALPVASAAAGNSNNASVSADGRYVAYESTANNLVANQSSTAIHSNIFLFDR